MFPPCCLIHLYRGSLHFPGDSPRRQNPPGPGGRGGIVSGGFGGLRELLWMFLVPPVPEPVAGSPETYNYVFVWCFSNLLGLRRTFCGLVLDSRSNLQAFRAPRIEFPEVLGPENPFNRVLGSTSKLFGSQYCLSNLFNLSELLK